MTVRWSVDEDFAVREAARRAGLTPTGFVAHAAHAALAAALGYLNVMRQDREALGELLAARSQLRRYGNNVNQAVRAFHSIGQPPPWLLEAIRLTNQAVRRIDQAADRLAHHPPAVPVSRPAAVPPDNVSGKPR